MNPALKPYLPLVDFIADCLGENTEVVLHDLSDDLQQSVVAIRNGHISGRSVGSPITNLSLDVLKTASLKQLPYLANYQGIARSGHRLKSSTFFIKNEIDNIIGMICINSDYHALFEAKEHLHSLFESLGLYEHNSIPDNASINVADLVQSNFARVCPDLESQLDRLTQKEKLEIVEGLNEMGTFLVKGAIGHVAESLKVSVPTIYRYLNIIKK